MGRDKGLAGLFNQCGGIFSVLTQLRVTVGWDLLKESRQQPSRQ